MSDITRSDIVEAIRENGYQQAFQAWIVYKLDENGIRTDEVEEACAIGQAVLNLRKKGYFYGGSELRDLLSEQDGYKNYVCPACDVGELWLGTLVVHLNDSHKYTPQDIAAHIDSVVGKEN